MQIKITAKQLKLTPATLDLIERKADKLERLYGLLVAKAVLWVEVGRASRHHSQGPVYSVKLRLPVKNRKALSAEALQNTLARACREAFAELTREMRKFRTRKIDFQRKAARRLKRKGRRALE